MLRVGPEPPQDWCLYKRKRERRDETIDPEGKAE